METTNSGGRTLLLLGWLAFLLVLIAGGLYGAYHTLIRHEAAHVQWGVLVPSYVFFALGATGSSIVTSIGSVFGVKRFKVLEKRGVLLGLLLIIPPWIYILLDLGKILQMYNLYILFHPTSRLAWMGMLYMAFALSVVVELIVVLREEHMPHWAPLLMSAIVLMVELTLLANLGALFGSVEGKPLWSNHLMALHFVVSAMMVGAASHILFISIVYLLKTGSVPHEFRNLFSRDYPPLLMGLIIINFALIAAKFVPGMSSPEASPYIDLLLAGPYSSVFWGVEVLCGGIIPFLLFLIPITRKSTGGLLVASVLMLTGMYLSKYVVLIAGQSISYILNGAFIHYFPEIGEILLVLGGLGVCLLLYTLGELFLPLDPEEEPAWFIFSRRGLEWLPGVSFDR